MLPHCCRNHIFINIMIFCDMGTLLPFLLFLQFVLYLLPFFLQFVLYPFGTGLSYLPYTVALDKQHYVVSAETLQAGGNISISATVHRGSVASTDPLAAKLNNGMQGAYSVLLFLSRPSNSTDGLPQRRQWLGDFIKVCVA